MTPIELLKEQLYEYEKAFAKSFNAYTINKIDLKTHETHKANLLPKIEKYRQAIKTLEMYET